jgi:hypothetical protein
VSTFNLSTCSDLLPAPSTTSIGFQFIMKPTRSAKASRTWPSAGEDTASSGGQSDAGPHGHLVPEEEDIPLLTLQGPLRQSEASPRAKRELFGCWVAASVARLIIEIIARAGVVYSPGKATQTPRLLLDC